ncbi:MAG: urease accessory protein UreD [Microbacteriaceae bacterium]|nr:urease accessory protein UreD [Microbacteriaceae bacterium]
MVVAAAEPRARVELVVGPLAPRLVERSARRVVVAVAASQMLLLDGDAAVIEVEVGPGCTLEIEDVGGTVAYPGRSGWRLDARVGAGARLVWNGLPFVVTAGAHAERRSAIELGPGAALLLRETIVLGRHGEVGGAIRAFSAIADESGPVLVEQLEADATAPEPGVLGGHRVMDSVIAAGYGPGDTAGALVLDAGGAVARHLGAETHASGLDRIWERWRADLQVREPAADA